jgi:hypothetical protein
MIDSTTRQPGSALSPATTLRLLAVVFTIALLVHAADHFRRGMSTMSTLVMTLGFSQLALALITAALVLLRHRWAPTAAMIIGFASAAGFFVVHILPGWFGPLSDSFINPPASANVTGFSWFAAVFEILADLCFGIAAVRARHSWP